MKMQSIALKEIGGSSILVDRVDLIESTRMTVADDTLQSDSFHREDNVVNADSASQTVSDVTQESITREPIPPICLAILNGDARRIGEILDQSPELVNNPRYSGFPPIHQACSAKNIQVLKVLLSRGANVGAYDALGNTALYLAVSEAWHEGIAELLCHGASPDARCEPPKKLKEMLSETPLHAAVRNGDLSSTNLLLEYQPNLEILDSDHSSILHLAAQARNLETVQALLKGRLCQDIIVSSNNLGNSVIHSALLKDCSAESELNVKEIIKLFKDAGADVNTVNLQGETPLFLAAQRRLPKVVELLLSLGANPTYVTCKGQTLLHAACSSGCATSLSHLLSTSLLSSLVTKADNEGQEPFHFAVQSSSIDCCELLLKAGDHLTRKDKDGISRLSLILNHLPSAMQLLQRIFDAHVRLSSKPQHDPDYRVIFDYSVLISPDDDDIQSSLISDLTTSPLKTILKHPLLESFLFFKWQKIKTFFYISVFVYFLYLLVHTAFIIITFTSSQMNWCDRETNLWIFISLHITLFILILIPDIIMLMANFKKYLQHIETYSKLIALFSSAFLLISCAAPLVDSIGIGSLNISHCIRENSSIVSSTIDLNDTSNEKMIAQNNTNNTATSPVRYAAAVSGFFGWIELMMLLARFPSLGAYVLMFTHVAKSIMKFMLAFSSLLIGFALSFMVLFRKSFENFPLSLIKTLMMMIGEIEYGTLQKELDLPIISLISLVLFLFLVCIVMANLLIGLAVNDIPDLQRQGKIRRLAKQAAYLVSYEKLISVAHNISCCFNSCRILLSSRCKILKEVSVYPNRDYRSHSYERLLPSETIHEAILLGNSEDPNGDLCDIEEESMDKLFKSFRVKYNRDRRLLNKKLAQLPNSTMTDGVLQERLAHMQQTIESRLVSLTLQVHHQIQQNQNFIHPWIQLQQQFSQAASETGPQQQRQLKNHQL